MDSVLQRKRGKKEENNKEIEKRNNISPNLDIFYEKSSFFSPEISDP